MIVSWFNRDLTDQSQYFRNLGFPYTKRFYEYSGWERKWDEGLNLSRHAREQVEKLERTVAIYHREFWPGARDSKENWFLGIGIIVLSLVIFAVFVAFAFMTSSLTPALFFLCIGAAFAMVPGNVWAYITVMKMRIRFPHVKAEIEEKLAQIMADNDADIALAEQVQTWVDDFKAQLTAADVTCHDEERIPSDDSEAVWRIVDVETHVSNGDNPTARDVTFYVAEADDPENARMLILPSRSTVETWLNQRLWKIRERALYGTHTEKVLESVSARDVLADVWQFPSESLSEAARLKTAAAELSFADRPALEIFGEVLGDGQVLLKGMNSDRRKLVFAPTGTVLQLASNVRNRLGGMGAHPALIEVEAEAA